MFVNKLKPLMFVSKRTFKNFGHKRQPIPLVTVLWHGFLTFTFIGLGIEWKRMARLIFGDEHEAQNVPWDMQDKQHQIEQNNTT